MDVKVIAIRFSEQLLLRFLREQGNEFTLTYSQIVLGTGISKPTIYRAMDRLEGAGLISRERGVGNSYIYKVHPHEQR